MYIVVFRQILALRAVGFSSQGREKMTEVHHIVEYHPYYLVRNNPNWREQYPDTRLILDFKDAKRPAIEHFKKLIISELAVQVQLGNNWGVAVVPSSQRGEWGEGLKDIAESLHAKYGVGYYFDALRRHQSIAKLAGGGDRSLETHLGTITINRSELPGSMILLDDVTSTGNSLRACEHRLKEAGVENVYLMAIGETTHGTP